MRVNVLKSERKSNVPRQHHYISKSYLKYFTPNHSEDEKLHVFDQKNHKVFCTRPVNVAKELDYFWMEPTPQMPDPYQLEYDIGQTESQFEEVVRHLLKCEHLPPSYSEPHKTLIYNIARLMATSPGMRDFIRKSSDRYLKSMMNTQTASEDSYLQVMAAAGCSELIKNLTYKQFRCFVEAEDEYQFQMDHSYVVYLQVKQILDYATLLESKHWHMAFAKGNDEYFATCDSPVNLMPSEWTPPDQIPLRKGASLDTYVFLFPLTSKIMMIGEPSPKNRGRTLNMTREFVGIHNSCTIIQAYRHAFLPSQSVLLANNDSLGLVNFLEGPCDVECTQKTLDRYQRYRLVARAQNRNDKLREARRELKRAFNG
ncbi:MAG: DUF4238 domain-containing protein [Oligoflexia bacterium]|nr:DUF4238 domain-containing protein [Oligoflexia bacterium]